MKGASYYAGLIIGIGLVLIIVGVIIYANRKKFIDPKFDEMQVAARGKAFRTGFFSLLAANVIGMFVCGLDIEWLPDAYVLVMSSIIGIAVFCISAIKNDAYFGFNENKKAGLISIGAIGLSNLLIGIVNISVHGIIEDGKLCMAFLNLMMAVLSAVIVIAALIRKRKSLSSAEEGEE